LTVFCFDGKLILSNKKVGHYVICPDDTINAWIPVILQVLALLTMFYKDKLTNKEEKQNE